MHIQAGSACVCKRESEVGGDNETEGEKEREGGRRESPAVR